MLEEKYILDQMEILRDGTIQIRHATLIFKDGEEIAKTYHRSVKAPIDNVDDQDSEVRAVASAIWTPKKRADYIAKHDELERALDPKVTR